MGTQGAGWEQNNRPAAIARLVGFALKGGRGTLESAIGRRVWGITRSKVNRKIPRIRCGDWKQPALRGIWSLARGSRPILLRPVPDCRLQLPLPQRMGPTCAKITFEVRGGV
jgi:hypothetical protein